MGTTKRSNGSRQVTYAGHPLYTFVGDGGQAGSTSGEGLTAFGGVWLVIRPSGHRVQPAADQSGDSGSSSGSSGYGY